MILPTISLRIERWKFNKEYGIYVSTLGNFKDRYKRRLPIKIDQGGYCRVKTEVPKAPWKLTHRLVMLTWKPIPDAENLTVDHLNHNKRDNSLYNLEWVTQKENLRRAKEDSYVDETTIVIKDKNVEYSIVDREKYRAEKAAKKAARVASIAGYSLDGEGCYTKQEIIDKLVSIRGEQSRKLTKKALRQLESGANSTGSKTFGKNSVKHIVNIIFKEESNTNENR